MPEIHIVRFWHPSGMRFLSAIITGGIARKASRNHRLKSGKPLACPSGTALPKNWLLRNISY
jgi:hypothetical protein